MVAVNVRARAAGRSGWPFGDLHDESRTVTGVRAWTRSLAMPVVLLALAAAPSRATWPRMRAPAEAAVASPEGAFLAYEHDVQVQLEAAKIAPRIQQIAQACQSAKLGDCAVLQVDQRSGEQPSGEVRCASRRRRRAADRDGR